MGKILWTYHFYRDGLMKNWKFTEKENKGAQEALGRDGGNESSSGEPS